MRSPAQSGVSHLKAGVERGTIFLNRLISVLRNISAIHSVRVWKMDSGPARAADEAGPSTTQTSGYWGGGDPGNE